MSLVDWCGKMLKDRKVFLSVLSITTLPPHTAHLKDTSNRPNCLITYAYLTCICTCMRTHAKFNWIYKEGERSNLVRSMDTLTFLVLIDYRYGRSVSCLSTCKFGTKQRVCDVGLGVI